jgi:hypothetical protein
MCRKTKLNGFPRKKQGLTSFLTLLKFSPLVGANNDHIDMHLKLNWRAARESA